MAYQAVLVLVLVAVGITEITSEEERSVLGQGQFRCPFANGRFPDPQECSRYYECRNAVYHPYQCPRDQLYDVPAKHCLAARQVNCGGRPGGNGGAFTCPYANGRYADPKDCSRYYECRNSVPYIYQCPRHELYDAPAAHCLDGQRVNCGQRPFGGIFTCPFPNGRYPDPQDCSRYYECRNSASTIYQCPRYQLYDIDAAHCLDGQRVNCGRRPHSGGNGGNGGNNNRFKCPYPNGRYADPQNCSQYYECRNSVPSIYYCPRNQLYDIDAAHCMDGNRVNCGRRPF